MYRKVTLLAAARQSPRRSPAWRMQEPSLTTAHGHGNESARTAGERTNCEARSCTVLAHARAVCTRRGTKEMIYAVHSACISSLWSTRDVRCDHHPRFIAMSPPEQRRTFFPPTFLSLPFTALSLPHCLSLPTSLQLTGLMANHGSSHGLCGCSASRPPRSAAAAAPRHLVQRDRTRVSLQLQ